MVNSSESQEVIESYSSLQTTTMLLTTDAGEIMSTRREMPVTGLAKDASIKTLLSDKTATNAG